MHRGTGTGAGTVVCTFPRHPAWVTDAENHAVYHYSSGSKYTHFIRTQPKLLALLTGS